MKYEILMFLLFHFVNSDQILVKEFTTVELVCPLNGTENDSFSWYYDESIPIVVQNKINPKFKLNYTVNNASNEEKSSLTIVHFTKSDQGKYSCQGIVDGEHQTGIVIASLCNIPIEIKDFSSVLVENSSAVIHHQTNIICTLANVYKVTENSNDKHEKCLNSGTFKLHISYPGSLEAERGKNKQVTLSKYTCLTLNEDQCMTSDLTFDVRMEWISCKDRPNGKLEKRIHLFSCDCALLDIKANSSCNETIQIYFTNKTLYLENIKTLDNEICLCNDYQDDIVDKIITTSKLEHADIDFMKLTYTFGGIAAFLGVSLLFASVFIIAMLFRHKRQWQSANLLRTIESQRSIQDVDQNNDPVVPEYLEINDSANNQSVELINYSLERSNASNSTYSRNASAYYESIDSRTGNSELTNELYNVSDNSSNSSIERDINAVVHQYINTHIGNTYEQLKNRTTDIHTYDDANVSV